MKKYVFMLLYFFILFIVSNASDISKKEDDIPKIVTWDKPEVLKVGNEKIQLIRYNEYPFSRKLWFYWSDENGEGYLPYEKKNIFFLV